MKKKKVVLAMSGGVDSSVAAYLLREKGYSVIGVTFKLWEGSDCGRHEQRNCCSIDAINDVKSICARFKIPHYVINYAKEFKVSIIDFFLNSYKEGLTPNPCVICNEKIKFPFLLEQANALEADYIATGHYARCSYSRKHSRYALSEAKYKDKDQSYVLFTLTQDILSRLMLPVGDYKKDDIRSIAKRLELNVHKRAESQEICFVKDNDLKKFLQLGLCDAVKKGSIKDKSGELLSSHEGTCFFTIGQRRGLRIAYGKPIYVTDIDNKTGQITVGSYEDTLKKIVYVKDIRWIIPPTELESLKNTKVKIRYKHKKASAEISIGTNNSALAVFKDPQNAPTPGQAAVFYKKGTVLGGGWITKELNKS